MNTIHLRELYAEGELFAQGVQAGEFVFLAQDARGDDGALGTYETAKSQTQRTLENLSALLTSLGQTLNDLVSLSVFMPNYDDTPDIAEVLRFNLKTNYPAVNFVGVCGLDGGCRVRMDAISTTNPNRKIISIPELPLSRGAISHGVRVGDLVFLSGVDAADSRRHVTPPMTIESQTEQVLRRIEKILNHEKLDLRNLCRTFMFMPGTQYRSGYGAARKKIYQGIFAEDEFPPNSGIYIRSLGEDILLRSVAIACRGKQTLITSPAVRKAPGSFSQSVRVGNWLLLAGQDAVGFDRVVEAEGSLAAQTEVALRHTQHIVEAAGGNLDDIVKTTVYLTEGTDRAEFAEAYRKFFQTHKKNSNVPSGLTVEVRELSPRCVVEIDSVAYLG